MARMVLTEPGEDVEVGGNMMVVGTTGGGEVVTVLGGNVTLDPSFNVGGDTVRLPNLASGYTVKMVGSTAVFVGTSATVTIPIGTTGLQVAFDDETRMLRYDIASGTARLGDQIITASAGGVLPVGVTGQILGTEAANVVNGLNGNEFIDGFGGNDTINGLGGHDFIRGGDGDDTINGGAGEDTIFGGSGNDRIIDNEGDYGEIDGGIGNDHVSVNNLAITSMKIFGGDGDDLIDLTFGKVGFAMVDAGSGNDRVVVNSQGMETSLLLGEGRDEVVLPAGSLSANGPGLTIIRDFEVGAGGDKISFADALNNYLQNYTAGSNPFASGHLKLIDFFGNAYLQVDRDGPSGSATFEDLINFAGVNYGALTGDNLHGFDPAASAARTASSVQTLGVIEEPAAAPQPTTAPVNAAPEPEYAQHYQSVADAIGYAGQPMLHAANDYGSYYLIV